MRLFGRRIKNVNSRFDRRCPVCGPQGISCRGGGNLRCRKRDPEPSQLAGILDTYGGLRFVVSHPDSFWCHVRPDETLIIVPGLIVHEPIAWDDIPIVIKRIELTVEDWLARGMPNEPHAREAAAMYRLRRLEQDQGSLDLYAICET